MPSATERRIAELTKGMLRLRLFVIFSSGKGLDLKPYLADHLAYMIELDRRGALAELEQTGGIGARSPAEVGAQADVVFTCVMGDDALDEVMRGLAGAARPGQIVTALDSHSVRVKQRYVGPLAEKGATFLDGE